MPHNLAYILKCHPPGPQGLARKNLPLKFGLKLGPVAKRAKLACLGAIVQRPDPARLLDRLHGESYRRVATHPCEIEWRIARVHV